MPTTIIGQNGGQVKQNTTIKVNSCAVQIVGKKAVGNTAYLTVQTFAAGRISGSGSGLQRSSASSSGPEIGVAEGPAVTGAGRNRGRPFKVKVRVGFVPKKKGRSRRRHVAVQLTAHARLRGRQRHRSGGPLCEGGTAAAMRHAPLHRPGHALD